MLRLELRWVLVTWLAIVAAGCAATRQRERVAYTPEDFRSEVALRAGLDPAQVEVPFEIDAAAVERARRSIESVERGLPRVRALVQLIRRPAPEGLGLRYAAVTSRTAAQTLALGQGNCVSLASVFVGLGRGLGWPVYYAEALAVDEEVRTEQDLRVRADHMVVLIVARTVRAIVDFSGPVQQYRIRVIDDMAAYAHLVNNRATEQLLEAMDAGRPPPWELALAGFSLATRIQPGMARAWNNQGVALARLGRIESARRAYARALDANAELGPTQNNLIVLETRARGAPSVASPP